MALVSVICMLGLSGSWVFDAPSGPTVVLTLGPFGAGALLGRQYGEHDTPGSASSDCQSPTSTKKGGLKTQGVS
jgi:hypothetical protein